MAQARPPADWPQRIAPMLADMGAEPFDSPDHLFEIKWDGIRCVALVAPGAVQLHNRRMVEIGMHYPELAGLQALPPYTIIDGEIVVLRDGKPSFTHVMQRHHVSDPDRAAMLSRSMPVTLMVFDVLYCAGENIMTRPLLERRTRLLEVIAALDDPHIVATDHIVEQGCAYFQAAEKHSLEGIVAKRVDSPYQPNKRSSHWVKIKVAKTEEFDIIGLTARSEKGPISSLLLGTRDQGTLTFRGRVGSGFTEEERQALYDALLAMPELECPPSGGPKDAHWRATGLRARIKYLEETGAGMLRGPVFVELIAPNS